MLRVKANVTTANPLPLFQYFILIYSPSIISNTGIKNVLFFPQK